MENYKALQNKDQQDCHEMHVVDVSFDEFIFWMLYSLKKNS